VALRLKTVPKTRFVASSRPFPPVSRRNPFRLKSLPASYWRGID
jgi:hypothetical protein